MSKGDFADIGERVADPLTAPAAVRSAEKSTSGAPGEEHAPATNEPPPLPPRIGAVVDAACTIAARRTRGEETPLPTPWEGVNTLLFGGLWPGLYTLTSTTGVGKTQWGIAIALAAAKHIRAEREAAAKRGELVPDDGTGEALIVALELSEVDVGTRVLGFLSEQPEREGGAERPGVAWRDLFYGRVDEDRIAALRAEHEHELSTLPLRVACVSPLGARPGAPVLVVRTPGQLTALVRRLRPRLLVLDYVQLLDADNERDEIRQAIKHAAIVGREAARDGAAVLFVSSTARGNYGRVTGEEKGAAPLGTGDAGRLVDLGKEAGELEFCADVALVLAAEPTDDAARGEDRPVWLAIAKGRGVERAWHPMRWNGRRFRDPTRHEREDSFGDARARAAEKKDPPRDRGNGASKVPQETASERARRNGASL